MPDICADESELIAGAVAGDADAFGELYQHYLEAIYRYVYFRVGDVQDAEDLTEQVFLKAWEALPNYTSQGHPFSSWLYRIAHNSIVDHYRRRKQTIPMPALEAMGTAVSDPPFWQQLSEAEEAATLAEAVAQLPELQQQVIILRFIEGLNHETIAGILEKSNGACRTLQYRALTTLNELLTNAREIVA